MYGFWALLLAICGLVAIRDPGIFLICNIASLAVWSNGCEKRGKNYWPASIEGERHLIHIALMLCVAGILVGITLEMVRFFEGAIIGLSAILIVLSWDLIIYDTGERYNEKKAQRERQAKSDNLQTNKSFLLRLPDTKIVTVILTATMLIVIFVAEYKSFMAQINEWLGLMFEK